MAILAALAGFLVLCGVMATKCKRVPSDFEAALRKVRNRSAASSAFTEKS
jgi:hypothetical protein